MKSVPKNARPFLNAMYHPTYLRGITLVVGWNGYWISRFLRDRFGHMLQV